LILSRTHTNTFQPIRTPASCHVAILKVITRLMHQNVSFSSSEPFGIFRHRRTSHRRTEAGIHRSRGAGAIRLLQPSPDNTEARHRPLLVRHENSAGTPWRELVARERTRHCRRHEAPAVHQDAIPRPRSGTSSRTGAAQDVDALIWRRGTEKIVIVRLRLASHRK